MNKFDYKKMIKESTNIVTLTLMNQNHEVLDFDYNLDMGAITKVYNNKEIEYAPIGLNNGNLGISRASLTEWFKNRTLPKTRRGFDEYLKNYKSNYINFFNDLISKYHGFNLSDQYWIKNVNEKVKWEDLNYFDNDFDDTVGKSLVTKLNYSSSVPSYSTNGNLFKYWKIDNNVRYLIKGGTTGLQEPFNEVVATALYKRVLNDSEYVPYTLYKDGKNYFSKCPDFIDRDTEFVPAWYIIQTQRQDNRDSDYKFFLKCCSDLGIPNVSNYMNKMLVCDYILGNSDRHYNNFGAIRDVNTLEFKDMSPIFDTGNSLGLSDDGIVDFKSKPFYKNPEKQLELVDDLSWLDFSKLDGFAEEAKNILMQDPYLSESIIDNQISQMNNRIDNLFELEKKLQRDNFKDVEIEF